MTIPSSVVNAARLGNTTQVFLKQFRDDQQSEQACYRQLVTAPVQVQSLSGRLSPHRWQLAITPLDSHPIAEQLGVADGQAELAFELEMDFILG